jgi:hypothetical protein
MADAGIKKVIINKSSLPAISGDSQGYVVRYRVVSEDKNRYSHWSPQYKLSIDPVVTVNHALIVNQSSSTINLVWDPVQDITSFDVYTSIDNGPWVYSTTVSTTSYSSLINQSNNHIQLAVQVPTYPKKRYSDATLFVTAVTNI